MSDAERITRRIDVTLHKPWFAIPVGARPTLVIGGRGQPTQWGTGTWQIPSDETVTLRVFLFNRLWRFGDAELAIEPNQRGSVHYQAPALPFLPGRMRLRADAGAPGAAAGRSEDGP